jgi:DNA-binding beta-propeller fold protein YncE
MWTPRLARIRIAAWSLAFVASSSACNLHNEGLTAPEGALSYPQALALSREDDATDAGDGADFLYVANTNYDLRYNGGSVQSYDLRNLDNELRRNRCRTLDRRITTDASVSITDRTVYDVQRAGDAGVPDAGDAGDGAVALPPVGMDAQVQLPGRTTSIDDAPRGVLCDNRDPRGDGLATVEGAVGDEVPNPDCCWGTADELGRMRKAHVPIDSYASGIAVAPDNGRLYVPVESFSRLLYFDINEPGVPSCGASPGERCRRGPGLSSPDDVPELNFPRQIAHLEVGKLSDLGLVKAGDPTFIATAHELGGFGLFVETDGAPLLEDVLENLPVRPTSLTFDPRNKLLYVTHNQLPYFSRLGVRLTNTPACGGIRTADQAACAAGEGDVRESEPRELLFQTSAVTLVGPSQPNDLRDIVLDPFVENRVWVLIRGSQEAVALLDIDSAKSTANGRLVKLFAVDEGPSKLARIQQDGRWFVLASNYDDKTILAFDAASPDSVPQVIRNLSGPFQMVHDPVRRLLYVTDFRVSVVRVVDVSGLTQRDQPAPRIVATLGDPQFEGGALN